MPFFDGYELLKEAIEYEAEEKLYLRWVVGYQTTTTYEEFKNTLRQKSINDNRDADDILDYVKELMESFKYGF